MKNWVPHKYCSAFVYKQYYYPYTYDRHPYFESDMISCHNMKYDPKAYKLENPKIVTLNDGTKIEAFGRESSPVLLVLVLILVLFLIY